MEYVSRLIAKLEPFLNHLSYQGVNMIVHDCSLMRFRFDLHRTELRGVTCSVNLKIGKTAMLIQVKRNKNRLKLIQDQTILIFWLRGFCGNYYLCGYCSLCHFSLLYAIW